MLAVVVGLSLVVASNPGPGGAEAAPAADDSIDLAEVPAEAPVAPAGPVEEIPELAAVAEATELRGAEAVDVLDDAGLTDEVAANAGVELDELVEELLEDESLFVGATGQVGYVEVLPAAVPAEALAEPLDLGDVASVDPFTLESRPGSTRTIFLDFTGHTTRDGDWTSITNLQSIDSEPYDTDGRPRSFSSAEQDVIRRVFVQVAEDYAPFDVNVTTVPPADGDILRRTSPSDLRFGQRVVITPSNFLGGRVLGIALIGSFDLDRDSPAFVFTDAGSSAKVIAEAVAHEVGHTVGLFHDGTTGLPDGTMGAEYYLGRGAWAPIMGFGDDLRPLTQWSRGEYPGANNQEDDVAEIAACLGVSGDDWPDVPAAGPVVTGDTTVSGVIGALGDVDAIPVDMGTGTLEAWFRPAGPSPNLHANVRLVDDEGRIVWGPQSPATPVGEVVMVVPGLPAGRYAIEIRPAGFRSPTTEFTSYGSMGHYQVGITAPPPAAPRSDGASATARAVRLSLPPDC